MIIYKDLVSGDELFSDSFPCKVIDDVAIEVEGRMVTLTDGDFDIGCGGDIPPEELADANVRTVIDIIDAFHLVETGFDKKAYMAYIKGFMQKIKAHLEETSPDRLQTFMAQAQKFVKTVVLATFKEWQFFTGESIDPEGSVGLLGYREDGITPYLLFFKDGLREEKA